MRVRVRVRVWNVNSKLGRYLVGFLRAKLDIGGVNVAVTYSTHFH